MSLVDECGFRLNGTLAGLRRLELLYVLREQHYCDNERDDVADRLREPHAVGLVEVGQNEQRRQEEQKLARKREQHAYLRLANALEEARTCHLCAYQWEGDHGEGDGALGDADERLVGSEQTCALIGHRLGYYPAHGGDEHGAGHGVLQHAQQTVVVACAVVVARNREHALVHAHVYHDEDERYLVSDAERSYSEVAAVEGERLVDEDDDDARAGVHGERRYAYGYDVLDDVRHGVVDAALEVDDALRIAEYPKLPAEHRGLRNDCGKGGSAYTHVQRPDEYRREDGVEHHRHYRRHHSRAWLGRRTQYGVQSEEHVRDGVAGECDDHILACIGQRGVAGAEEAQYRVEEEERYDAERNADDDVKRERIAEHTLGCGVVFLSQLHRYARRGTYAHTGSERRREVLQGKCNGKAADGECTAALSDEYTVCHVVERRCRHGSDGGQSVLHQQLAHGLCAQLKSSLFAVIHKNLL